MAIKVAGTEVISDARTFKVTGADGNYSDLKIGVTSVLSAISGTSSLSFSQTSDGVKSMKTYLSAGLSGDVTWALSSGSNPASGRSMTILVDASASGHDQSLLLRVVLFFGPMIQNQIFQLQDIGHIILHVGMLQQHLYFQQVGQRYENTRTI